MNQERALAVAEKEIIRAVSKFCKQYGGEFSELFQEAYIGAIRAIRVYRRDSNVTIKWWINFHIWKHLREVRRTTARRGSICQILFAGRHKRWYQSVRDESSGFSLGQFCAELSEDAAYIVGVLAERPELGPGGNRGSGNPGGRVGLRRALENIGWAAERIENGFAEIERAIT